MTNLDSTECCSDNGGQCEACGRRRPITIATINTPLGVVCVARCSNCHDDNERPPSLTPVALIVRVQRHCSHLGIGRDAMDRALRESSRNDRPAFAVVSSNPLRRGNTSRGAAVATARDPSSAW